MFAPSCPAKMPRAEARSRPLTPADTNTNTNTNTNRASTPSSSTRATSPSSRPSARASAPSPSSSSRAAGPCAAWGSTRPSPRATTSSSPGWSACWRCVRPYDRQPIVHPAPHPHPPPTTIHPPQTHPRPPFARSLRRLACDDLSLEDEAATARLGRILARLPRLAALALPHAQLSDKGLGQVRPSSLGLDPGPRPPLTSTPPPPPPHIMYNQ